MSMSRSVNLVDDDVRDLVHLRDRSGVGRAAERGLHSLEEDSGGAEGD